MGSDQLSVHVDRMGCGVTNQVQAVDIGKLSDQLPESSRTIGPGFSLAVISIDVLTQQGDFANTALYTMESGGPTADPAPALAPPAPPPAAEPAPAPSPPCPGKIPPRQLGQVSGALLHRALHHDIPQSLRKSVCVCFLPRALGGRGRPTAT